MKKTALLFAAVCAAFAARSETIFLECEQFKELGGWKLDSQFRFEMGSTYLIAHGLGVPVADAKTTFAVPKAGRYNVFARTKNWTAKWSAAAGAGAFKLAVNGRTLPNVLGVQGQGEWLWVKADDVDLKAGENTVAIQDLKGFDGRVDAVCFTTDAQPPARPPAALKAKFVDADLTVVGGGVAGICTAISAARLGLKVALVQDRPILGGANSSEVRVHLGGHQNLGPYPRLGDVVAEIGPAKGGNAQPASQYEDDRKMAAVKAEKNITLFLSTMVEGVDVDAGDGRACGSRGRRAEKAGRILAVYGFDVVTGEETVFRSPLYADCTGDGTVGYLAGADYRLGRESKAETGEDMAPEQGDKMTLGASVQWYAKKETRGFPHEPWMIAFNEKNCEYNLRGDWDWETGMLRDQLNDFETVRDYGLLVVYSNWSFIKNYGKRKAEFADATLDWVAYVAGKRETRRLLGDHVLCQQDVFEDRVHPDGTCCTTWAIDLHYPMPANQRNYPGEPFRSVCTHNEHHAYPIPYRCFYSRNVPNLFMAGRDISVTHVALGTTRVMRTHGMQGEVVGMAASICKKERCDPRGVYERHLDDLKALMRRGVGTGKPQPPQDYNRGSLGDDTAMLQKLLDSGKGRVEFPEGLWTVSRSLVIGSDTHLVCSPRTSIRLRDWANCPILKNRSAEKGEDRNITVEGGTWDGNNVHQKRGGDDGMGRCAFGQLMVFAGVRGLRVRDVRLKDPDSYCLEITDVVDFEVSDVVFDCNDKTPNQDGLHVDGFARDGLIRNLRGHTNDDLVALNSDEGDWRSPSNDIVNVTIDGIYGGENGFTAVRLLSRNAHVENIVIRNVYGKYKYHGVTFTHWAFDDHKPGMGHFDNVVVENMFAASCLNDATDEVWKAWGPYGMIYFQDKVESVGRVTVRNLRRIDPPNVTNKTGTVWIGEGVKIDTLILDNVDQVLPDAKPLIHKAPSARIRTFVER